MKDLILLDKEKKDKFMETIIESYRKDKAVSYFKRFVKACDFKT